MGLRSAYGWSFYGFFIGLGVGQWLHLPQWLLGVLALAVLVVVDPKVNKQTAA